MAIETLDLTADDSPLPVVRKRKPGDMLDHSSKISKSIDLTQSDGDEPEYVKPKRAKTKKKPAATNSSPSPEKRLKRYREACPVSLRAIYDRAVNQRMFCLHRDRGGTDEVPTETLKIAGSTGNVYTVKIDKVSSCDCPHAVKHSECKHILFVLVRVLKAKVYWQRAYLSSELREIFENAPPIVPVDAEKTDNNRKPIHDDDTCPICFMQFENGHEDLVWCKAACGNNIHKECFQQWAASRRRANAHVTCVYCRSRWLSTETPGTVSMENVSQRAVNDEGYANVAGDLGISTRRDYSSYHSFWVRREARRGVDVGDWIDPDPPAYWRDE